MIGLRQGSAGTDKEYCSTARRHRPSSDKAIARTDSRRSPLPAAMRAFRSRRVLRRPQLRRPCPRDGHFYAWAGRRPRAAVLLSKPADAVVPGATCLSAGDRQPAALRSGWWFALAGQRQRPGRAGARYVFGYAVGLDLTRRDVQARQEKGHPWDMGRASTPRRRPANSIRSRRRPPQPGAIGSK